MGRGAKTGGLTRAATQAGWKPVALSVTFHYDKGFGPARRRAETASSPGEKTRIMAHVVVVGAGIAGVPAAYSLKAKLGPQDRVTVISDRDYFHFVPSNPWVAMGWRKRGDVAFPIGPYLAGRGIDFVCQSLERIAPEANQVHLADGSAVEYDFLLLATGPKPAFGEIEGMGPEGGYTHSILHIEHAVKAFAAYREFLKDPGPIIVGVAQNAATIGPAYEFAFLADADLRRRNMRDQVPITVVTPEPYVGHLGVGGKGETRGLLETALHHHGIAFVCNAKTLRVTPGQLHIAQYDADGTVQTAHTLPFAFSVYWPPFRGADALANSPGLADGRGFVTVDEYLRSPGHPNIFAVGLCRAHGVTARTPIPVGPPESVYSIQNDVDTAVANIAAALKGEAPASAAPRRAQWLRDMGETGASYLTAPQIPLRDINWLKEGWWVHMAKVEFEKYFLDKIKLKPAAGSPGWSTHVATALTRRQVQRGGGAAREVPGPAMRPFEVPLERDLSIELKALAKALDVAANTLAGELLNAAILDARLYLSEEVLALTQQVRRELLADGWPEGPADT